MDPRDTRIAQLEAELAAARHALQEFTAVVGHDLRAPLRHIVSYAQLVQEDAGPQLAPEVQGFLHTISDSAQQLAGMLDGLLALARLGNQALMFAPVALAPLLAEITQALQTAQPQRTLDWQLGAHWPTVQTDAALLRLVLQQVLDNAVKFSPDPGPTVVEVTASVQATALVIQVRDHGVGLTPAATLTRFTPFARLHSAQTFAGMGLGLAQAQAAMQRLGGSIHLDGAPGMGCTVRLHLPLSAPVS